MILDFIILLGLDFLLEKVITKKWYRAAALFFLWFGLAVVLELPTHYAGIAIGATLARASFKKNKESKNTSQN